MDQDTNGRTTSLPPRSVYSWAQIEGWPSRELRGSVAICVGKRLANLRRDEVTGSSCEVNDLIGRSFSKTFPAIDLAHGDLP